MRRHFQIRHRAAAQNDLPQKYHKISRDGPVLELISQSANPVIICGVTWHQMWTRFWVTIPRCGPEDPSTRRQSAMLTSWVSQRDSPRAGWGDRVTSGIRLIAQITSRKIHVAGSSICKSCETSGVRESEDKPQMIYKSI